MMPARKVPSPHACGMRITELALYQVLKVSLLQEGVQVLSHAVPVIENKRALFRAFLALPPGAPPGNAAARLVLTGAAGARSFDAGGEIAFDSTEATLTSTFNFDVPADAIRADTRYHIELDTGTSCPGGGLSRYPLEGDPALAPKVAGVLKVVVVPVRYDTDGSGRMPDVSDDQLQGFWDTLMALYPTAEVALRVREPVSTLVDLKTMGDTGWGRALDALREVRDRDGAAADVYYYGLVSPAATFSTYCRGACVAGLSYLAELRMPLRQVGIGVGFLGQVAADTFAHELGHQHGRAHANCGATAGLDRSYPYDNGSIGVWGFDFSSQQLMSPARRKDLMGYCSPLWISDYNYSAIADRRLSVTAAALRPGAPQPRLRSLRSLLVDGEGQPAWGRPLPMAEEPVGRSESARVLDASGAVITEVSVYRTAYGHGAGASFEVPPAEPGWAAIQVAGASPLDYRAPIAVPALEPVSDLPR
jgi:hypothetical protein